MYSHPFANADGKESGNRLEIRVGLNVEHLSKIITFLIKTSILTIKYHKPANSSLEVCWLLVFFKH